MTEPDDKTIRLPATTVADSGSMVALAPGHTILEYQIERVLGEGGFGITYLAQDINLQLPVAIKEYYPADLAARLADHSVQARSPHGVPNFEWGLERFIDEARALASFRHANIVRVLRFFKENGTAYIVMEYESGDPLKRWLAQQPSIDRKTLLRIIYPLMDGLEVVHKLNFLHRDIKPDNIYIRADGTPVLLDFGAARKLTANQDMTNIVSPGFAPFEQYHGAGSQGPWTDLYSLGAVMYWMVTGNKPMESASRVLTDGMSKATSSANVAAFGLSLLRAIDWALTPDETQRPQTVAMFRQAVLDAEHSETPSAPLPNSADGNREVSDRTEIYSPVSSKSADPSRKNVLATIMFLDLVAYSTYSVDQQVVVKKLFNQMLGNVIDKVKESSRIMLDTGDGAAICFMGDPEEALHSALLLRDLLMLKQYSQQLSLRIGLHIGPIRIVQDINRRVNVVGDGINVAQRIMNFSEQNQIFVSRAYYDVVSRISERASGQFIHIGERQDKHMRSHDLYAVIDLRATLGEPSLPVSNSSNSASTVRNESIPEDTIMEIEAELANAIGPLAKILIKKTIAGASSAEHLRDLLSVSIPDAAVRATFVLGRSASQVYSPTSRTIRTSRLSSASTESRPMQASPARESHNEFTRPASFVSSDAKVELLSAEQRMLIERALGQYIGPLSKTLVRKEIARQPTFADLLQALAQHIDVPEERTIFLNAAQLIVRK